MTRPLTALFTTVTLVNPTARNVAAPKNEDSAPQRQRIANETVPDTPGTLLRLGSEESRAAVPCQPVVSEKLIVARSALCTR